MNYTILNAYQNANNFYTRYPLDVIEGLGYEMHLGGREKAFDLAGVEIRYLSSSTTFDLTIDSSSSGFINLFIGSFSITRLMIEKGENHIVFPLHERYLALKPNIKNLYPNNLFRIILESGYKISNIIVNDPSAKPYDEALTTYCLYGSSFTQGVGAFAYTYSYAGLLGHLLNCDILNKGLSGNCLAELSTANYLATLNVNAYILELGCNMRGYMDDKEFAKRIDYLLAKLKETKKPIYVISSLTFFVKEFAIFGQKAPYHDKNISFSIILENLVKKYNLIYVPMTDLMLEFKDVSYDMLHPSIVGHLAIANNLAAIIKKA